MDEPGDDRDCDKAAKHDVHRELGCWTDPGCCLTGLAAQPSERLAKRVEDLLRDWSQTPQKITQRAGDGVEGSDDCLNHIRRLRRHKGQHSEHHCPTGYIYDHSNGRMNRKEPVVEEETSLHSVFSLSGPLGRIP